MSKKIAEIAVGHANSIRVQLTATNVDTGSITNLSVAQMNAITKVSLVLDSSNIITSGVGGIGLGAGEEFDQTTDTDNAILVMTLGSVTALTAMVDNYDEPHLDIYFSTVDSGLRPVKMKLFKIKVTAADS